MKFDGLVLTPGHNYAVVEFSVSYMRSKPTYTSALVSQALMGTVCEVLERSGYWAKIRTPEPYEGWVNDMAITPMSYGELTSYLENDGKLFCTSEFTHIFAKADENSERISELLAGDIVLGDLSDKPVRKGRHSYVKVTLPSGKCGYARRCDVVSFPTWAEQSRPTPENVIATAKTMLGSPYLWGGTSPKGTDCSGLTRWAYLMNGVLLPRDADEQITSGVAVDSTAMQPGDLVFFGRKATADKPESVTHVGMYIGGGRFIHSSHKVRINSFDPNEPDYYPGSTRFLRARRVWDQADKGKGIISVKNSPFYFRKTSGK